MKVALLTREFPPEVYGGAGVHVEHLAVNLAKVVDVEVHCFGQPRESPLVAATYRPWEAVAGGPGGDALQPVSVDLLMAQGVAGVDVVHSHTWYTNLGGHLAKQMHDIAHIVTTHSLEPLRPWKRDQLGPGYGISLFCERVALNEADAVIAVSEGMRSDILQTYPAVDPDRVVVIHNGVDPGLYRRDLGAGTDPDFLARRGIDRDRPSVVFLGRITAQKGILELLEAARWIDPSAQLVLCAASPDTPAIYAAVAGAIETLRATRAGVVWVDEPLSRPEAVQILSHASVFVCPSRYEPFGLVNVEAMACGVPVVASAVGGLAESVVDGVTGVHVPPRNPDAIAGALATFLADSDLRSRMGGAGARRARQFGWERIAALTIAAYRTLVSRCDAASTQLEAESA